MLEIVKWPDGAEGFEILPRRCGVERTFAWLGRCRRLARDFERTIASAEAWILVATSACSRGASQENEIDAFFLIRT